MKKTIISTFLIAFFALSGFSQDTPQDKKTNKPIATYKVGDSRVVVWENTTADGRTWKNFQIEKSYLKDDELKTTNSFNEKELLDLKEAINKAISEEIEKTKNPTE